MAQRRILDETIVNDESPKFELKLPAELVKEPKFTVAMPGGKSVDVYEDTNNIARHNGTGGYEYVETPGYRIVIRDKSGKTMPSRKVSADGGGYGSNWALIYSGAFIEGELELAEALKVLADALTPVKRTTTRREEDEGD